MTDTKRTHALLEASIVGALHGGFRATALRIADEVMREASSAGDDWEDALGSYYERMTATPPFRRPSTVHARRKARIILMARDILCGDEPKCRYPYDSEATRSSAFSGVLSAYEEWMRAGGKSEATVRSRLQRSDVFLRWLESAGVVAASEITPLHLSDFVAWLAGRYSAAGKSNILYTLRNLFACPDMARELSFDPSGILTGLHTPKRQAIPSVYSRDEVRAILDSVDRETHAGRTTYLVVVLASVYGLRSGDIKLLTLDDVDFSAGVIRIVQHKTGAPLVLPLVDEVRYPLLDYLMRTRRQCDHREVLIKHRGTAEPYSRDNHFGGTLRRAIEASGVVVGTRRAGLHALRHSLATELLSSGVPVSDIATVLGHRTVESTKAYVWSDVEHLRVAALEVG